MIPLSPLHTTESDRHQWRDIEEALAVAYLRGPSADTLPEAIRTAIASIPANDDRATLAIIRALWKMHDIICQASRRAADERREAEADAQQRGGAAKARDFAAPGGGVLVASSGIVHAKHSGLEPAQTLCGLPATGKTWTLASARPITCKQCRTRKGARQ